MNYKKFSFIFGFSIWLFGTLPFSFWGDKFFLTNNLLIMALFYIGIIPILYLLTSWVFKKYQLTKSEILESTILMSIPALILDAFVFKYFHQVFPTLNPIDAGSLSSFVIWIYGIVLILGLLKKSQKDTKTTNENAL